MHSRQNTSPVPARRAQAIAAIAGNTMPDAGGASSADVGPMRADADPLRADATAALSDATPALSDTTPVLGLIDLDHIADAYSHLSEAFAGDHAVLHAVACKAVPLRPLLSFYAQAGAGCEVASPGELELALAAGFAPETIVFDSPAKTLTELHRAVELGVSMNIDNFAELDRLDAILADGPEQGATTSARVGIRINPQSGSGTIGALSTATQTSKFGIGLSDDAAREAVVAAYLDRPWLTQIHVHSGSQGIGLDQAAEGVAVAVELAREINARAGARQVTRIDIGGGLPVNFAGEVITPTFAEYRQALEARVPELFDFDIITEFGRALLAKAGTILTRVEYAKTTGGRRIAMTHAGVQVATRTAYAPADWPLRILPFDPQGTPKLAEAVPTDVAGPACFAGDLLAQNRMLPRLDAGDLVAVPETGAYYFSNPFSYNLLPRVPVYGYRAKPGAHDTEQGTDRAGHLGAGNLDFLLIRRGQTIAEVLAEAGEDRLIPCSLEAPTTGARKEGDKRAEQQGEFAPH